jgi:hypothetical protein
VTKRECNATRDVLGLHVTCLVCCQTRKEEQFLHERLYQIVPQWIIADTVAHLSIDIGLQESSETITVLELVANDRKVGIQTHLANIIYLKLFDR